MIKNLKLFFIILKIKKQFFEWFWHQEEFNNSISPFSGNPLFPAQLPRSDNPAWYYSFLRSWKFLLSIFGVFYFCFRDPKAQLKMSAWDIRRPRNTSIIINTRIWKFCSSNIREFNYNICEKMKFSDYPAIIAPIDRRNYALARTIPLSVNTKPVNKGG